MFFFFLGLQRVVAPPSRQQFRATIHELRAHGLAVD